MADTLREAFQIAGSGRKGPVLVDIPKDITAQTCEYERKAPLPPLPHDFPIEDRFRQALEMIARAERPFLYCGGGVISSEAEEELRVFAERLDAPVACSLMCQGGFDQADPRYMGMLGMHGTNTAALAIKNCDLFVAVGTRFSDRVLCNAGLFARHCPIIQIEIDTAEFNKNIEVQLKVKGDAKEVLERFNRLLPQQSHPQWMEQVDAWKKEFPLCQEPKTPNGVTPQQVIETLDRLTDDDTLICTEVGQNQMWAAQFYTYRKPRTFISSGGLGTMGFGLGAAIGAKIANPQKTVVNIAGDGSFHMNCAELATAAAYHVPIVELILNNEVLGMVRQWQKLFYDNRFSQTDVDPTTNFPALAEAFGLKAYTIETADQVEPVLREALSQDGPVLIDCRIDPDINVLPMVPAGAAVESPILEMDN